jgi:hypothetical protein
LTNNNKTSIYVNKIHILKKTIKKNEIDI